MINTRELAERPGVHPETIRRAAQRGELESIRIGLDRIYAESAINRWLGANLDPAVAAFKRRRQTRLPATGGGSLMAIRKRGRGRWQVRVRPFPEVTLPTKEAAETVEGAAPRHAGPGAPAPPGRGPHRSPRRRRADGGPERAPVRKAAQ